VRVKAIAEACDIPTAYLAKIVNVLAHKQLVTTQRGGGVELARPSTTIELRDLGVALDDPLIEPRCMFGHARCKSLASLTPRQSADCERSTLPDESGPDEACQAFSDSAFSSICTTGLVAIDEFPRRLKP